MIAENLHRAFAAVPERGYRVARCVRCGVGFTWKHADQIGCPDCGTDSLTTSTRQRKAGFWIVEGDELIAARIVGLAGTAAYHRNTANRMFERAGNVILSDEWGPEDENGRSLRDTGGGWTQSDNPGGVVAAAMKALDKAANVERKRARLIAKGA